MTRLHRSNDPPQAARVITTAAACALVLASAGFGATYAWRSGEPHGLALAGLGVVSALGLEGVKPFALSAALASLRAWRPVQAVLLLTLALAAVAFSVTAELSLMTLMRSDAAAQRAALASTAGKAEARYVRAKAELEALPSARPAAEVQALIDGLLLTPGAGDCSVIDGKVTRTICPRVAELRSELARAQRRAELEAVLSGPKAEAAHADVKADPAACALAVYLGALGIIVPAAALSEWLALVPVLALEIGSAFAVVLVGAVGSGRRREQAHAMRSTVEQNDDERITAQTLELGPSADAMCRRGQRRVGALGKTVGTKDEAALRIVDALQEAGGKLPKATERGLAALIGGRKSSVHNALAALIGAGIVARVGTELILQQA